MAWYAFQCRRETCMRITVSSAMRTAHLSFVHGTTNEPFRYGTPNLISAHLHAHRSARQCSLPDQNSAGVQVRKKKKKTSHVCPPGRAPLSPRRCALPHS